MMSFPVCRNTDSISYTTGSSAEENPPSTGNKSTACIKKWSIMDGSASLMFGGSNDFFVQVTKGGKVSVVLKDKISNIPQGIQKNKEVFQKYLDNTYLIVHDHEGSYTISVNHRLLGGMFNPKPWGHGTEAILGRGAVYKAGSAMGHSRLHVASTQGWFDDVEKFVNSKDDINMVNTKGNTPLDDALRERHPKIAEFLRDNGAKRSTEI